MSQAKKAVLESFPPQAMIFYMKISSHLEIEETALVMGVRVEMSMDVRHMHAEMIMNKKSIYNKGIKNRQLE